jgi:hypothetical protein
MSNRRASHFLLEISPQGEKHCHFLSKRLAQFVTRTKIVSRLTNFVSG